MHISSIYLHYSHSIPHCYISFYNTLDTLYLLYAAIHFTHSTHYNICIINPISIFILFPLHIHTILYHSILT
ncbi:hypothetical protein BDF19DRAFT_437395 [Syncephalis fuscata]|nr:hypothetical protein BDF19DRAFT_437384 [Syncephalis fuscata]KAI9596983.1 hypothetical protein BDF19DRAFT_437395 [Syncephalis fuscata]